MVTLNYQQASPADIPEIIEAGKQIWIPAFARYFHASECKNLFEGMYNPLKLEELLSRPGYRFYFVKNAGCNLGYYAVEIQPPLMKLDKIYVSPDHYRQGFGGEIYRRIEAQAHENDVRLIQLNVNRRNVSAISFYRKLKFEIVKSVDIPGPGGYIYDDYVMEKKLY